MKTLALLLLMVLPLMADDSEERWKVAQAIKKEDVANGYAHVAAKIFQVVPGGFICNLSTRWGIYDPAFVKCDAKDLVDGQSWTGIVIPTHPYQYTTEMGASATIPAFTTNLKEDKAAPAQSNYVAPRAPVSSSASVGGG